MSLVSYHDRGPNRYTSGKPQVGLGKPQVGSGAIGAPSNRISVQAGTLAVPVVVGYVGKTLVGGFISGATQDNTAVRAAQAQAGCDSGPVWKRQACLAQRSGITGPVKHDYTGGRGAMVSADDARLFSGSTTMPVPRNSPGIGGMAGIGEASVTGSGDGGGGGVMPYVYLGAAVLVAVMIFRG